MNQPIVMMKTGIDMETFFLYFLQTSVGLTLFYLLYLLLLKNETFYRTNRFYLLGGLILAFLLPLFPISFVSPVAIMNNSEFYSIAEKSDMVPVDSTTDLQVPNSARYPWGTLLLWVYLAGLTLFLVRLVWSTLGILWKIRHTGYQKIDGIKVIDWKTTTPFSFFNVVFIDIQEYSERELSKIIAHEKVHICERHWIDLLIIELLAVLFWVNPVVWLYEKSIKQNHEYLADQGVLLAGYSPGQYQALLINQLMGVKLLGFAHNLNFSLNKKRMEMMKKEKSPGASKMKLLLALPVVALLVFAFAKKEYVYVQKATNLDLNQEKYHEIKTLKAPLQISGQVFSVSEVPIEGAQIEIYGQDKGTDTNKNGTFVLYLPANFKYVEATIDVGEEKKIKGIKILVKKQGYDVSTMLIDPDKDRNLRKVILRKQVVVKGRVRNYQEIPLVHTEISVKGTATATNSDMNGEFEIEASEGRILTLSHRGYNTIDFALVGENLEYPTIYMRSLKNRTIPVKCTVTGMDGQPLEGASVIIQNTNTGTITDENGKFSLEVPDSTTLIISHIGYKSGKPRYSSKFTHNTNVTFGISLPKREYNIELPEVNGEELILQPPPRQPATNFDKNQVFMAYEELPYYPNGGIPKLAMDIHKGAERVMSKTNDRGVSIVSFKVSANGSIFESQITESSGSHLLDSEAINIIQNLSSWIPANQNGKAVSVDLTVPVKFEQ